MIRTSGATSVYRSMRPPTAEERQGARPPAVSIATVETGTQLSIIGLGALVHRMLQELGSHPNGASGDRGFDQERREARADRQHRGDEEPGDLGPQTSADQVGGEQQDH